MEKGYNMTRIEMMRRKINECLSENLMTNVTFEITSEVYSDSEEFTVVFAMGQYRATLLVSCVGTNTWVYHSYIGYCACSGSKYYRSIISVFRQMVNDIDDYKEMWEVVAGTSGTSETTETSETAEAEETKGEETEESTASKETYFTETAGSAKRKTDNQAYNFMCYNCKKFLNGCRGEKNKIYSGCVYKEKMEVRNNG